MVFRLFHADFSAIGVLLWGNALAVAARWQGVTPTVRLIKKIAPWVPISKGGLGEYSDRIDALLKNFPFLFYAHRQVCLIRGLLLFFFGKRRKLDIRLHFGSKIVNGEFNTHCWILLDGEIRFEVDEVIRQYTTLIEYS